MVEYRELGGTGIRVSSIALGTMTWGQQNTEVEAHAPLDYALDAGINFIDTAENYAIPPSRETQGSTERYIGAWIASRRNRDKFILATKVSGPSGNDWLRDDGKPPRLDARNINEAIDKSLARLKTDYVDLYQLHWPNRAVPLFGRGDHAPNRGGVGAEVPIEETLDALADLVKAGKVRHIGLSNETAWGLSRFLHVSETTRAPRVVSVQNAYNLLNRTYEAALAEFHDRERVGLLAYSPLAQGFLTGKYQGGARPANERLTLFNRGDRYLKPGVEEATDKYIAIARELGVDPAQFAIAYVASRPFVTSAIIGATTLDQLKADIAAPLVRITPEIESQIDAVHQLHGNPAP